LIVAIMLSVFS